MFKKNDLKGLEEKLVLIGGEIQSWRSNKHLRKMAAVDEFKTNADLKASELITNMIRKYDSLCPIISEEDAVFHLNRPDRYWLIDPIDGTASWYDGFDGFVTQIAYIERCEVLYGAVFAPVLKKLWTGLKGKGAYLNGQQLPELTPRDGVDLVDNYPKPKRIARKIKDRFQSVRYLESGSLGLKCCMVADGSADLFVKDVSIYDWDVAPASVILKEVNGIMCNLFEKPIEFTGDFENSNGLIVARSVNLIDLVRPFAL